MGKALLALIVAVFCLSLLLVAVEGYDRDYPTIARAKVCNIERARDICELE